MRAEGVSAAESAPRKRRLPERALFTRFPAYAVFAQRIAEFFAGTETTRLNASASLTRCYLLCYDQMLPATLTRCYLLCYAKR